MDNKMVLGIGLFFRSEEEYYAVCKSTTILIEGFLALDRYTNTYEVSCKLKKENEKWDILYADSFQLNKKDDIRNKFH